MQHPDLQNILQFLNNMNNLPHPNAHMKIIVQPGYLVSEDQFNLYSDQIKNLFQEIFVPSSETEQNKKKEIKLKSKLKFENKQTPMPICNKILSVNQPVFRCYDCMTHEASVICKECFQHANHKGHRYNQISSGGGNCDCGNPDAIKPQGFCVHHPGKAEPVIIDEIQQQHFLKVHLVLFQWVFRLHEKQKSKSSDILGQIIADFLSSLNERSLYYNTLTFMLFYSKRRYGATNQHKEQKIIDKFFQYGVKLVNLAKKITDVFFKMFSLQIFKYQLTVSFSEAYNRIQNFQTSKFRSLYIQLFANNDVVQKMLNEKQLVLYPQTKNYDFKEYVQNLMFLSTIKPEVASKFFVLLNHKGYVRFPEMDLIQQQVEQKNKHIIEIINNHLNTENFYYLLMESIIKLLQNYPNSLIQMLQHYSELIMDKRYTYEKNKVIMPFHKILAMILLSIYKGKIDIIDAKEIQKLINYKYSAQQIFTKIFRMILGCFKQYSRTFFETSYFDNYIPLYAKSGNTIVVFDLLMFSVSLEVFNQVQNENIMNEILFEIFDLKQQQNKSLPSGQNKYQNQLNDNHSNSNPIQIISENHFQDQNDFESISSESLDNEATLQKTLKINVELIKIMIEACISERSQILIGNSIGIQHSNLKQETQNIFVKVMKNFKQITSENLKQINKSFIETKNIEEDLIKKFLTFDKNKKKFILNKIHNEKYQNQKFSLYLCPSLRKFGGIFAQEIKDHMDDLTNLNLSEHKVLKLKFLFNEKFLYELTNQFINSLTDSKDFENKEIKKIFSDFVQNMKILQILMRGITSLVIDDFFNRLIQLCQKEQFKFLCQYIQKRDTLEDKKHQKQSIKMKFQEKKKKKLQKMKQMQAAYDQAIDNQKIQEQQNQSICIICRQDKPGLCFLASFNYSNILQALNKLQGRSLVFNSCFHPIHIQCFNKVSKHIYVYLPCPLCKTQSNIMLPFEKQISNLSTVSQTFQRIITLKATFSEDYKGFDGKFEQFGILSIFRALCSIIGKNVIRNQPILDSKDQRLANILYNMAQIVFKKIFNQTRMNQQKKGIQDFIECLRNKIQQENSQETNFYAFQYVSFMILYLCFEQKSNNCLQLLSEPYTSLINNEDMRKIWQMCDQIVSLPMMIEHENKLNIKPMSSIINLYQPPQTVFDLIKIRDQPKMLCKNGHQMCICLICKQKGCLDCKQINKHLEKIHCGEGVAFNLLTGGLIYRWEGKMIRIPSFYCNQMGFEWLPSKSPEGFVLDRENYEQLKLQILNESIMKFLSRKYPNAFKKNNLYGMDLQ